MALLGLGAVLAVSACGGRSPDKTLYVAGIPDQNASGLARRYDVLTTYLSEELGVDVEYVPTVDYAATVVGFRQGAVHLGWFGGLTGVMARLEVEGAEAIAQRPRDRRFHSVFIVQAELAVAEIEDLRGLTFTFGSELSTSGHLMPRHFLVEAGIDPDADFNGTPSYSGSHDKTWKLVESGVFQAGVLSEAVWESALGLGKVDAGRVRVLERTPAFYDYNWTIRGDVDSEFSAGFKDRVRRALLDMGQAHPDILRLFSADAFIASDNSNYAAIREVAEALGVIE